MQIINNYRENIQHTNSPEDSAQTNDINSNLITYMGNFHALCCSIKDRIIYTATQNQIFSYQEIINLVSQEDEPKAAQELEAKLINLSYYSYEKLLYTNIPTPMGFDINIIHLFFTNDKFILLKKLIEIMEKKYKETTSTSKTGCEWAVLKKINMFSSFYSEKVQLNECLWNAIISTCINLQANLHYLDSYLTHNPEEAGNFLKNAVENNKMELLKKIIYFVKNNLSIYKFSKNHGHKYIDEYYLLNTAAKSKKNLNAVKQLIELRYPDKIIPTENYIRHVVLSDDYMIIKQFFANNKVDWNDISIFMFDEFINRKISVINTCIIQKFSEAVITLICYEGNNPYIALRDPAKEYDNLLPPIFWAVYNKDYTLIDILLALYGKKYSLEYIQKYIQYKDFNCDDDTMRQLRSKLNNPVPLQKIALVHWAKFIVSQMNKDTNFNIEDLKQRLVFLPPKWVKNIHTIKDLFSLETIKKIF